MYQISSDSQVKHLLANNRWHYVIKWLYNSQYVQYSRMEHYHPHWSLLTAGYWQHSPVSLYLSWSSAVRSPECNITINYDRSCLSDVLPSIISCCKPSCLKQDWSIIYQCFCYQVSYSTCLSSFPVFITSSLVTVHVADPFHSSSHPYFKNSNFYLPKSTTTSLSIYLLNRYSYILQILNTNW